jgi:hypothetical protein
MHRRSNGRNFQSPEKCGDLPFKQLRGMGIFSRDFEVKEIRGFYEG